MITITDLHAAYDGEEILHGVSAVFPKGKISVILGPNGCGKSTTLKTLMRLIPMTGGTVTVDGRDLNELSQQELARVLAYLPQGRNIPDITVKRLVMHGRFPYLSYPRHYRPEDYEIVAQALEWVGLTDFGPKRMENISGGQRQKVYLAMALAQDTPVILMDEPTTYLDIKNQFEMLDCARMLTDMGKTVVMILHDFEAALHYADHVVLMNDGKDLIAGDARTVLSSEELRGAFHVTPCFIEAEDGPHCYVRP
ncbi:MAG: ABC transporter ATP-binding protein [Oscillospiraceae bacterium]|nr:ABC transporter ATP-binding protein [Oscillospiraceae bacterium]